MNPDDKWCAVCGFKIAPGFAAPRMDAHLCSTHSAVPPGRVEHAKAEFQRSRQTQYDPRRTTLVIGDTPRRLGGAYEALLNLGNMPMITDAQALLRGILKRPPPGPPREDHASKDEIIEHATKARDELTSVLGSVIHEDRIRQIIADLEWIIEANTKGIA